MIAVLLHIIFILFISAIIYYALCVDKQKSLWTKNIIVCNRNNSEKLQFRVAVIQWYVVDIYFF